MRRLFFSAVVLVILLTACEENQDSYIIVKPTSLVEEVDCGDVLNYSLEGFSTVGFRSLQISLKPENEFSIIIIDTVLDGNKFKFNAEFRVPSLPEKYMEAELTFRADESDSKSVSFTKYLKINNNTLLSLTSGHELFSSLATGSLAFDAFSFDSNQSLHSAIADSSLMHIKDDTDSTFLDSGTLGRKWVSPAGAGFVRFNDFDFGNADQSDLIQSYRAGLSSPYIDNLQEKDIILIGYVGGDGYPAYCVVRINSIIDGSGLENDRYIFDLKK